MSTEVTNTTRATFQGPLSEAQYTSVTEAQNGQVGDGRQADADATAVVVEQGDTVSAIMARYGMSYPQDYAEFVRLNPQFAGRSEHLIYPGEVLYVPSGEGGTGETDGTSGNDETQGATDTDGDGIPDPETASQAQATTDAAATALEQAEQNYDEYMRGPGPKGMRHEYQDAIDTARTNLANAIQAEIETGLRDYIREHPDATPAQIEAEAERLGNQIQGRSQTLSDVGESTIDYRTQQAINAVSAEQRGINLAGVAPGTDIQDGPYTDTHGPFAPNSTIQDEDGRDIRIDANGYPANGTIPVTDEESGETRYVVYEDGVATGQEWDGLPERPAAPATPPQPPEESPVIYVVDPPATNADETDAAAQAYYEAGVATPDGAGEQREAFMAAVRAELATGASLESIKARYGNDPWLNQAIDEAAYGPR